MTKHSTGPIQYSLRDALNVIFQHQLKIIIFFLAVFITVSIGTYLEDDIFESYAKLLIHAGRQNIFIDPSGKGNINVLDQTLKEVINSELDILRSHILAEQVVDKIGAKTILNPNSGISPSPLEENFSSGINQFDIWKTSLSRFLSSIGLSFEPNSSRTTAITKFQKNLTVETDGKSHIISLSYQAKNAEFAQYVLKNFVALYLDRHIEVHQSQTSLNFFKKQSQLLKDKLIEAERRYESFGEKNSVVSMQDQKRALTSQITNLQTTLDETKSRIISSSAMIASFEKSLQSYPSTNVVNSIAGKTNVSSQGIKRRLIDLRVQERDLAMRFQNNARPLIDVREQIKLVEKELAKEEATLTEVTTSIDTNYQAIMLEMYKEQSNYRGLIAQSKLLETELENRKSELSRLVSLDHEHTRLQREIEIAKEAYYQHRDNLQRAETHSALDLSKISNVRIVQPAFLSTKPVGPQRLLKIFLGFFLGLFGSISLAFVLDFFDDSLKTDMDITNKLGLPVLAMFSDRDYQKCVQTFNA